MITREQAVQALAHVLAAEAIGKAEGIKPQVSPDLVRDLVDVKKALDEFDTGVTDGALGLASDEALHDVILTHLDMAVAIVKDGVVR